MKVTRAMISAAHDVTMKSGIVLSHKLLTKIYQAMNSIANHAETSSSPPAKEVK